MGCPVRGGLDKYPGVKGSCNTGAPDTETGTEKANISALMNLLTILIFTIRVSVGGYFNFSMYSFSWKNPVLSGKINSFILDM